MSEESEKEVYEVERTLNTEAVNRQIKEYVLDHSLISLVFLGILAVSPPALGLTLLMLTMIIDFIVTREEEDLDEIVLQKKRKVDNDE